MIYIYIYIYTPSCPTMPSKYIFSPIQIDPRHVHPAHSGCQFAFLRLPDASAWATRRDYMSMDGLGVCSSRDPTECVKHGVYCNYYGFMCIFIDNLRYLTFIMNRNQIYIISNRCKPLLTTSNAFQIDLNRVPGILINLNQFESNSYVKQVSVGPGIDCLIIWEFVFLSYDN